MKVLIACEESQRVCIEFRKRGHEAIGHQQWKDSGEDEWDTRSHKPMMCGEEPIPKIERIDE